MTKTRKFSNAFRKCDFCGQEISLDTKNHTMSCSGVGTPIMTPSAKRIKLTSLNLESNEGLNKTKRLSKFLGKYVESVSSKKMETMRKRRERCEDLSGSGM